LNEEDIKLREDDLVEYRGLEAETLPPRRPDNFYVQEMIAKSKAMCRERLAKVARARRRR
jgi:hypothetical protein